MDGNELAGRRAMELAQAIDPALEQAIERYRQAADAFGRGDPEPVKAAYSHRDDVALANPFGPPVVGWASASAALDYASSRFRDGGVRLFERVAQWASRDLCLILELEHWYAKVAGREEVTPFDLRVTTAFRFEDGAWKVVHRHADPITTPDPDGPIRASMR